MGWRHELGPHAHSAELNPGAGSPMTLRLLCHYAFKAGDTGPTPDTFDHVRTSPLPAAIPRLSLRPFRFDGDRPGPTQGSYVLPGDRCSSPSFADCETSGVV
jgi:hypothetical protein